MGTHSAGSAHVRRSNLLPCCTVPAENRCMAWQEVIAETFPEGLHEEREHEIVRGA